MTQGNRYRNEWILLGFALLCLAAFIVFSLGQGMYYLAKDDGDEDKTRVVRALPASMKTEKERLAGYVRETIDGCLVHRRSDGLFHDVLDDPSTFVETNLAQMLAYSIYRGTREGWLEARYLQAAERLRTAALAKVDAEGYVRGVCGSPTFDRAGTATEGQAFCLLMEAARAG